MVVFAALGWGWGDGTGNERTGQHHFRMNKVLHELNPAFEQLARIT